MTKFMDLNDNKDHAEHEEKNTPKDFRHDLVEAFNDPNDNDDLYVVKFTSNDDIHQAREGYASFFERIKTGMMELNMKIYNMINIKQSQSIYNELGKAYKLFRKFICRSGHHTDNPWDYAARVNKELTGIGQLESVYWYLFCTQTESRVDEFNLFYGLDTSSVTTNGTTGAKASVPIKTRNRKKDEDEGETQSLALSLDNNTAMLRDTLTERNKILEKSSVEESLRKTMKQLSETTGPFMRNMLHKMVKENSKRLGYEQEDNGNNVGEGSTTTEDSMLAD